MQGFAISSENFLNIGPEPSRGQIKWKQSVPINAGVNLSHLTIIKLNHEGLDNDFENAGIETIVTTNPLIKKKLLTEI